MNGILDDEEGKKDQTYVSFRCTNELKERLERSAKAVSRARGKGEKWSRSRLIVRLLLQGLNKLDADLAEKSRK